MYMSGAKVRVTSINHDNADVFNESKGFAEFMMKLATNLFPYGDYGTHLTDRMFAQLENMLNLPITNRKTELWCTPVDIANARSYLNYARKPIYALCMGGDAKNKHYSPEKYARLLKMILNKESTATFVILGGGQEDLKSAEILKNVAPQIYKKSIIDLTDKINYRQSVAILKFCEMYIGNDTGTMHVAAAENVPVLVPICFSAEFPILNTDMPNLFHPYGVSSVIVQPKRALPECKAVNFHHVNGCGRFDIPHCITQITPETLFKGFHLLKKRVAAGINEPLYFH